MINNFNKQLIKEKVKLNSAFEEQLLKYQLMIEQEAAPAGDAGGAPPPAPPAGDAGGAPAEAPPGAASGAAAGEPAKPGVVPNKPYSEILTVIAKALTVNLDQEGEITPENDRNIKQLKNFVGEVLEGGKVKKMDKAKALQLLDKVQKVIDNVVGGIEEI